MQFNIKEMKHQGIFLGILAAFLTVVILVSYFTAAAQSVPNADETPEATQGENTESTGADNSTVNNNQSSDNKAESTAHEHNWVRGSTVAPTCTEGGYTINTCFCGESKTTNEKAALGHELGEWKVTKEATETEDGIKARTCTRCNQTIEQETIKKTGTDEPDTGNDENPEGDTQNPDNQNPSDENQPEGDGSGSGDGAGDGNGEQGSDNKDDNTDNQNPDNKKQDDENSGSGNPTE